MYDTMSEALDGFDDMLNDIHGTMMGWTAAEIMREMDPAMYREEFHNWLDAQGVDMDSLEDDADLP